jgi:hypothetical protein
MEQKEPISFDKFSLSYIIMWLFKKYHEKFLEEVKLDSICIKGSLTSNFNFVNIFLYGLNYSYKVGND